MTVRTEEAEEVEETIETPELVVKHETLAEALLYAQMEYPPLMHNQMVDFFSKKMNRDVRYSYVDLPQTKSLIGPCLRRHGLVINSKLSEDNTHLITRMRHIHSDEVDETSYEIGKSGDQKEQGGNITWARRYNYWLLTGCVGEQDNDAERISREPPARRREDKGQEGKPKEKEKPDKNLLNKKKDHAFYLSNAYGLPDDQMKEECRRWYNSKHADEKLVFESRGKFQISDWVGYMAHMGSQFATQHQLDILIEFVDNSERWQSGEGPEFLQWVGTTLDQEVVDISNLSREKVRKLIEVLHKLDAAKPETEGEDPASDDAKTWPEKVADVLEAEDFDLYLSCAYRVNIALAPPDAKEAIDDICKKTLGSVKLQKSAREGYNDFKKWMEKIADKQKIWAFLDVIGELKEETQDAIFHSLGVPEGKGAPQKVRSISPALFAQWRGVVDKCVEGEQASDDLPF